MPIKELKLRGRAIRVDAEGRVSLNDIHRAGGFTANQKPSDWVTRSTSKFIAAVAAKKSGKSGHLSKSDIQSVLYIRRGAGGGFWADPIVALAYAKYLSDALHIEVNETFLRYKAGDATLADEVLERASPEANEWAATRAMSRAQRNEFTGVLKDHGVQGYGYAQCTDAAYEQLFGAKAKDLKVARGLPVKANLRDKLNIADLSLVIVGEAMASGRIRDEKSSGNKECRLATSRATGFLKAALDAEKADRSKPLV